MDLREHGVRGVRATDAVLATSGLAALAAAALISPSRLATGPVLCPFRLLTGVPCPSCGMTRSWVSLTHGDLGASISQHPLGPATMALVVIATIVLTVHLATGRWLVRPMVLRSTLIILAAAIGVFGALRWALLATGA